jgi:hypothetical protein
LNPPVPRIQEIVILGGLPGSDDNDPTVAAAGDMRWERAPAESFAAAPAESFAAFRDRTRVAAEAAGVAFIVFGGLIDCSPYSQTNTACPEARAVANENGVTKPPDGAERRLPVRVSGTPVTVGPEDAVRSCRGLLGTAAPPT